MNFDVDRTDLHRTRLFGAAPVPLGAGDARLRVDGFALTSNNITYGAFGDALQYWNFFPAEDNWGRIPVWGFGEVVESRNASVAQGERVYGYFPMSDELVVTTGKVDGRGFADVAPHRQPMAGAYNRYLRVDADPIYDAAREGQQMVLWPLFFTSFMIDDSLADNEFFGVSQVIISSASSKTAIGSAHLLHDRAGVRVIGLTSDANRAFVEKLGCYHDVVTYGEVDAMAPSGAIFIDIAGNRDVQAAVHERFGDQLVHSMIVGGTHWDHTPVSDRATRRTPAGVLLRAHANCEAHQRVGSGRARPPGGRRVAFLQRVDRRLARASPHVRPRCGRGDVSRVARRPVRPPHRTCVHHDRAVVSSSEYLFDNEALEAGNRFGALAALFDPVTVANPRSPLLVSAGGRRPVDS